MVKGKVKFYDSESGYGNIVSSSGLEMCVYANDIVWQNGNTRGLQENQDVEFDVVYDRRGRRAVNVEMVEEEM